ncbi:hypothetical protein VTP01DRAFT_917 [Rhizomucor pusillus]|uniref:uncharacterized protein n=1 Tax=Rhizomucor pusillus TaxID=4840 RepID=UPI003742DCBC
MDLLDKVTGQLESIDLKDDDISAYIAGIVQDESIPTDEKRETIADFLSATTEQDTEQVISQILDDWKAFQEQKVKLEADKKAKALQDAQEREKARQAQLEKERQEAAEARQSSAKQLTKEERAQREKLMQQYGYDLDEIRENEQGEAEVVYKDRSNSKRSNEDSVLGANRNAEIIKQQEQQRREQMKKQVEAERERNKMLLEKQRLKEEKEKRRTQKREKRRL